MKRRSPTLRHRTKPQTGQRFEAHSYVGTDIGQLHEDGERPPRSAKLVVDLDLGSHPGGGDYRTYLLSTNRQRSAWTLWIRGNDWDKPLYCRIATGRPYRGYPARFAAEQLLIKSWKDARDKEGWHPPWASVFEPGLLNHEDVDRIKLAVFGE
jgi:hypothetical protein